MSICSGFSPERWQAVWQQVSGKGVSVMHHKLLRIFVGILLAMLFAGCAAPSGTSIPPAPTQVPAGDANPTPIPGKVSSYEECLRALGSLLMEGNDPPQCVTKDGEIFRDGRGASAETIRPTVGPKEPGTDAPAGSLSSQGPWLLYMHNSPRPGMYDVSDVPPEFLLLNPDGTGRTPIKLDGCFDGSSQPGSAAYLAKVDSGLYLVQPAEAVAMLVDENRPYPTCPTYFNDDEKSGLLASITGDTDPELIVHEVPGGTIRDRFALVNCSGDVDACNAARSIWDQIQFSTPKPQWSPNGRYLAFAALQDASSDLFIYDSQDGSLRRLTSGIDWVGPIEWSPDGTHIVMQELLNEDLLNSSSDIPSSVWSVSVSGNEIKLLYKTNAEYMRQTILQWLDDHRFIAYEGSPDPMEGSLNPRFVDMDAGTSRLLLDDWFGSITVDPVHETIALVKQPTEKSAEGVYLISIESGSIRRLERLLDFQDWDPQTGWFVTSFPCEQDPEGLQALDYQGNFHCAPRSVPTPSPSGGDQFPSPDGKQNLIVKDGLWLKSEGQAEVQISPESPSDVTWCPASTCFFFTVPQPDNTWTLYHVSLPGMTVKTVDEGIQSTGSFQWLGGEK